MQSISLTDCAKPESMIDLILLNKTDVLAIDLIVLDSIEEQALLLVWRQPIEALHSDITQHVGIQH
jgi:hypothetical protein